MIRKEDFAVIKTLKEHGVYQKDIAAELGVHPKTVSRALKRNGAPKRERVRRGSQLEHYQAKIDSLLSEGVWNVRVILREIQAEGYRGGYSILRKYIQPKRALRPGKATVRFETKPGEQMQSDWGEIQVEVAGRMSRVHFEVNQLGYSRRFHFWCTDSEDAEHTYEGMIRSFEYFGGVSGEVLVDNQKSAVLEHPHQGQPCFNERFLDLAGQYGFTPRACKPYRARTKGKDERMVGYIKGNFFVRYRAFESWAHMNQLAEKWLREEADQRLHGTVWEVVAERFDREKPCLKPLPPIRYDTSYLEYRQVAWDGYIDVRGNRYSVPATLVGQRVSVRIGLDGLLRVYQADTLACSHMLRSKQEGWSTVAKHHAELWESTLHVEQRSLAAYEEVA
ncbi:MAG TPA: IS21 family transposase [Syntrophobacteraceae bacterium]|nr:IS21 family transposase [Syntrophobacteraceae bacterium]